MSNGSMHSMHLIEEVTYGVVPATPSMTALRHTKCSLGITRDTLQSEELRSDRQLTELRTGTNKVGGNVDIEIAADVTLEALLEGLCCSTWVAGTLKAGTLRKSYSILRHFGDLASGNAYHLLKGMEVNSLDLKVSAGKLATGTFNLLGATQLPQPTAPTGATLAAPTTTAPMDAFTGVITEGGTAIAVVTELSLKLINGLAQRFVIGSRDSLRPQIGRSLGSGSLTAYFETDALLNKFLNDSASSLQFQLTSGAHSYTFKLPNIKYTAGQPDVQGEGSIMVPLQYSVIYDGTTSTNIEIDKA